MKLFYGDAKHGRTLPAGANVTILGWFYQLAGEPPVGPFDHRMDALEAGDIEINRRIRELDALLAKRRERR